MKIMYLARRPIPSRNANSVQIVTMCEAFAKRGHEVTLIAHPGDAPAASTYARYGVDPVFAVESLPAVPGKTLQKWRYLLALRSTARRLRPDLLFGRDIWSLVALAGTGKPLVYEAHIIPRAGTIRWRMLQWLFARRNFSHLVCVTSTLAESYRRQFPALAGKAVLVAPNAALEPCDDGAPLAWPWSEDRLQVGFVGRPFPGKGIEMLVEAAGHLRDIDFHVIGSAREKVTWLPGELPSNLHFHGYQPHAELGRFYRHLDVAVAPYGAEVMNASGVESAAITSPLKLIEYMAAGLPTIVSDLPGVRDILNGSDAAVLVQPGDVPAFVEALKQLAMDKDGREAIGKAARRRYLDHHTTEARARHVLEPVAAGLAR